MRISSDFLIIGGGVTGLTTALCLAEQGSSVTLIDRQQIGREASWAGAGMLPPGNLARATTPEARLRSYSHSLWHDFAAALLESTGVDTGYRVCGCLELDDAADGTLLNRLRDDYQSEEIVCDELHGRQSLEVHCPEPGNTLERALFVPAFGQVRNPRHLKALHSACQLKGVRFQQHITSLAVQLTAGSTRVRDAEHEYVADRILVAAGAWSSHILSHVGFHLPVTPVRGQMLQLQCDPLPFRCVIQQGKRYLVPRADGLLLAGSTEEHCGFDKSTTAAGIHSLLNFAISVAPALSRATVRTTWAGLRPGSPDALPYLGLVPGCDNLYVAAGHFRSGLQMSVGTGHIMADLMLGRTPQISLEGLHVDRALPGVASSG
jgi:glycine oxidase